MPGSRPTLRAVTLNLWGDRAPLDARLDVAAAGLGALAPDVVFLQEVRAGDGLANTGERLAARLAAKTGAAWRAAYRVATSGPAGTWGPGSGAGEEGLAILSPHLLADVDARELPDARALERRILLSARVDAPAGAWRVHTTHLHWRPRDADARARQLAAIDAALRATPGPQLLGGDLNAAPDTDEVRGFFARGWRDAYAHAHAGDPGLTWSARNPNTATLAHVAPLERRIDYLVVAPSTEVLDARVVLDAPTAGVFASDHFGVYAELAAAAATP
jgi:endonuclease/exonuclease/phosphatase family metal-dependent hydrolase